MAMIETWLNQDLQTPVHVQYLDGNVFSQDNLGNLIGVHVFDDGEPAVLSGTVSGNVIRADGGTVAVSGTLSGNDCYIILPEAAYAIPGPISIIVKLAGGGSTTTLGAIIANVYQASTDAAIDPGTIIPDISTLIAAIEEAVASIPADYSELWETIAPNFDPNKADGYKAGQFVTYNGGLYEFIVDHVGSWASGDVSPAVVGGKLTDIFKNLSLLNKATETNRINIPLVLKGWVNGTGYVDNDGVMSPGVVISNSDYDTIISTDFSKYTISLYYFSSPTNKYPTFKGNNTAPFVVPKGQLYSVDIRYKAGVSTLDAYDVANIPAVTKFCNYIGIWNDIDTNIIEYSSFALKAWQNGTGFISDDRTMGYGKVLVNNDTNTRIITDFDRYTVQLYYFSSPSNLYPHFEGNMRSAITVPPGQYFTFFVRNRAALQTLTDYDIQTIPKVTQCIKDVGVWNGIEEAKKKSESIFLSKNIKYPFNAIVSDYSMDTQIQGAVAVDGKIYQFTGGGETIGEFPGHIYIIDPVTGELSADEIYHDFGHVACLGYDKYNDTLVSGRVISDTPIIQIYKDFAESAVNGAELSPNDSNCISISLASSLMLGRTSFDVLYGENFRMVYAYCTRISTYYNNVVLYKILLGTGSTDLSGESGGYGTMISGAADDEYNGTCQVLQQWYLPYVNRQPQTMALVKGSLYMLTSNSDTILHQYKYVDGEYYESDNYVINDITAAGSVVAMEGESLVQIDGLSYIGLWDKNSPTKMRLLLVDM